MGETRGWVDELLPSADSREPQARAELVWTAQVTALEVGDDAGALAARELLEPLLAGIQDPVSPCDITARHGVERAARRRP
jgi:hypothetical protein